MHRVLMISPHFPPDSTAATHRVRLLAPHMAGRGWEPTVLTVDPRDYEGRLDPTLFDSVPQSVRIVRTRAWPARASRAVGVGDLGIRAFQGLWRGASDLLAREHFDAVFITIYPTYPALLGPLLKRRFKFVFVLDYQDPWVGEWGRSAGPGLDGRPDFKSRASRFVASGLEPYALRAADAVTAVSCATYEQALARTPRATPLASAELPIGWDRRDLEFLDQGARRASIFPIDDDGLVHLSYVGTLLPTGLDTLRAVLAAVAALRATSPAAARLRLHFFGTSNQRTSDAPQRVIPVAAEYGLLDVVTESAPRLDYFEALRVLRDSTAVLLMGSSERHYTPSKVFPALVAERPVVAVLHAASNASDLLQRIGRAPTVRLITYDDQTARTRVDAIATELSALISNPRYIADAVDERVLEPASACALAGRLAQVMDRCLS
jgi:glycosyltransferase involved in cell wall biosynthesis